MVIDRIFLWVFVTVCILGTTGLFIQPLFGFFSWSGSAVTLCRPILNKWLTLSSQLTNQKTEFRVPKHYLMCLFCFLPSAESSDYRSRGVEGLWIFFRFAGWSVTDTKVFFKPYFNLFRAAHFMEIKLPHKKHRFLLLDDLLWNQGDNIISSNNKHVLVNWN